MKSKATLRDRYGNIHGALATTVKGFVEETDNNETFSVNGNSLQK
jgi:hypothetical protein